MDTGRGDARPRERRPAACEGTASTDYWELVRRSQDDPEWFWPAVVEDLGLEFSPPVGVGLRRLARARVDDLVQRRDGVDRAQLRPPLGRARARTSVGAVFAGEDGSRRELTFAELSRDVTRLAEGLVRLGVEPGDRVAIYLPMCPEVAVASHACAHIGAVQMPLFSGFAAPAVMQRLRDSEAKVVITADYSLRRGRRLPMRETVEEAVRECPVRRARRHLGAGRRVGRDRRREPRRAGSARGRQRAPVPAHVHLRHDGQAEGRPARPGRLPRLDRPRGRLPGRRPPRGRPPLLHGHGLDHGAVDGRRRRRARLHARLRRGGARPARPTGSGASSRPSGVSVLGLSPTLVRALIPHGEPTADLSSLRVARHDRRAVESGPRTAGSSSGSAAAAARSSTARAGTEVGRLLPLADAGDPDQGVLARRARAGDGRWTSSTREGESLVGTGEVGELVCRRPFPGMTRGFWRDPERYLDAYWRRFPGVWVHGDWASVDEDGYWFLHGRSDDTLNIAGKRIGPAELESAAVAHPAVSEAAAVGVPHEVKGEVAWIFCVAVAGPRAERGARRRGGRARRGGAGQGLQARPGRVRPRPPEDAQRQDRPSRRSGAGARPGPRRPLVRRESRGRWRTLLAPSEYEGTPTRGYLDSATYGLPPRSTLEALSEAAEGWRTRQALARLGGGRRGLPCALRAARRRPRRRTSR